MQVIGYAHSGAEFEVRDRIIADGMVAVVPRQMEAVSRGKKRKPKLEQRSYLPNYVFIDCEVSQFHSLSNIKGLASTKLIVPTGYHGRLTRWAKAIETEAQRVIERHKAGEAVSLFNPGDMLRVKGGPFLEWLEGKSIEFERMVGSGRDASAEVRVDMMGQSTKMRVDVLDIALAR